MPCIWADTKPLDSKIGEYTAIARKDWNEKDWYLGAITNDQARDMKIALNFLDKGTSYTAEIYADGPGADYKTNPYPVAMSTQTVDNTTVMHLKLASGGGVAIKFSPVKK